MSIIYHIVPRQEWETAAAHGRYEPASVAADGFIHCSTREQVAGTANAIFAGRHGLVLLAIEEERVGVDIVYEDCYQTGQQFPHIYGPLDPRAVVEVIDFPCDKAGRFPPFFG